MEFGDVRLNLRTPAFVPHLCGVTFTVIIMRGSARRALERYDVGTILLESRTSTFYEAAAAEVANLNKLVESTIGMRTSNEISFSASTRTRLRLAA